MSKEHPTPNLSTQTLFASISLHQYDRLRLLNFPTSTTPLLRNTITRSWARGVQSERPYGGSHEFKLYGNPWQGQGEEAMHARRLMLRVLATLWDSGWLLHISTDVSKKQTDKDTLVFRYQAPAPPECEWLAVSFSRSDRVRLMDAPVEVREAVVRELGVRVQESRPYVGVKGTWEVKLYGTPWMASGEETMVARAIVLSLIAVLERFGFTVYASIDQKATTQENRSESDTWHCRRLKGWAEGPPIYHN